MDAPAVAVSADGKTIAVAWMDMRRRADEKDAFWKIFKGGKAAKDEPLGPAQEGEQGHTALAIDDKGVVHAVWCSDGKLLHRTSASADVKELGSGEMPSLCLRGGVAVVAFESGGRSVVKSLD